MCEPINGFRLCTCQDQTVIRNKKTRKNKPHKGEIKFNWYILRFLRNQGTHEMGRVIMPSQDIGNGLTENYVLGQLNFLNCFDFDYLPQQKDCLYIKQEDKWDIFLAFTFIDGKWVAGARYDKFNDEMEEIRKGKLKPLSSMNNLLD